MYVGLTSRWSGRSNPDEKKHFKESPVEGPVQGKSTSRKVHFRESPLQGKPSDPNILSQRAERPRPDQHFSCFREVAKEMPNDQGSSQQRAVVVLTNDLSSHSSRPKNEGATKPIAILCNRTVGSIFHVQLLSIKSRWWCSCHRHAGVYQNYTVLQLADPQRPNKLLSNR